MWGWSLLQSETYPFTGHIGWCWWSNVLTSSKSSYRMIGMTECLAPLSSLRLENQLTPSRHRRRRAQQRYKFRAIDTLLVFLQSRVINYLGNLWMTQLLTSCLHPCVEERAQVSKLCQQTSFLVDGSKKLNWKLIFQILKCKLFDSCGDSFQLLSFLCYIQRPRSCRISQFILLHRTAVPSSGCCTTTFREQLFLSLSNRFFFDNFFISLKNSSDNRTEYVWCLFHRAW